MGSAVLGEEVSQKLAGFFGTHSVRHFDLVIEARVVANVVEAVASTRLEISGAVHQAIDPAVHHCPCTHQAGLEGDHQRAAVEPPRPDPRRSITQRQDLGVSGRVTGQLALVVAAGNDFAVHHHDRADRHIAMGQRKASFIERENHQFVIGHDRQHRTSEEHREKRNDLPNGWLKKHMPDLPEQVTFSEMRAITLELAAPLSAEDQVAQSMPDASPTKWHLAHTTWFWETFLLADVPGYEVFDPTFGFLFNSYYNAIGERQPRAERGLLTRPSLLQVHDYRAHVDKQMEQVLTAPTPAQSELVDLGINHEQQHQELILMDAQHLLSRHPFPGAYTSAPVEASTAPTDLWHQVEGGLVDIGYDGDGFAFDNEGPRHQQLIGDFEIADSLVTCGQFADFIADAGYERPEFWLSDGWAAVSASGRNRPLYWADDGESVFGLHGRQAMDVHQPLSHISFFEADAYARWADARLPTEAEWEIAAGRLASVNGPARYRSGASHHPVASTDGGTAMMGTLWEWTASPYVAYPEFRPAAGAVGEYNGKFMNNQYVLRGGSYMTPVGHTRSTYRNFFPPHTGWQASGVRLARQPA